jgi:uncharacterized protein
MRLKIKPAIVFTLLILIFSTAAAARAAEIPPLPPNPVVDLAGIINDSVQTKLNRYLRELEQKTTAQMAILTVKSLQGQSIEEFSIGIAHDKWKLGQKGKDNGILLVIALKERKYRIEVGYGLEGILPDSLVGSIGRQYLVPYFKQGDYADGIYAATLAIANVIAKNAGVKITGLPAAGTGSAKQVRQKSGGFWGKMLSMLFFLVVLGLFFKNPRSFLFLLLLSSMGGRRGPWGGSGGGFGGGGFGSFGGGGGGFGGGGGGFGGGGASGSW